LVLRALDEHDGVAFESQVAAVSSLSHAVVRFVLCDMMASGVVRVVSVRRYTLQP